MAEVILNCPQCQRQLRVTEDLLGRPVKCPACGLTFSVPAGSTEAQVLTPAPVTPAGPPPPPRPEPGYPTGGYQEPQYQQPAPGHWDYHQSQRERAKSLMLPPAICLLITGILGTLINLGQVAYAAIPKPAPPVHQGEPKDFRELIQRAVEDSQSGPGMMISGGIFALVSLLVVLAAIQALRMRSYGFAMAGNILAMINIGQCCCILGLPFGIWGLVALARPEVKSAFQ